MAYDSLKLEKGMYHVSGKNFTQLLEELDPTQTYAGTPLGGLDAYQRQLKRYGIKVAGEGSSEVDQFFQTADSAALFPEYVSRAIHQGMEEANLLGDIVATKTVINGLDYRSVASIPSGDDKEMQEVAEGTAIPSTKVVLQENLVQLKKRGRMLEASYEAIRFQKLDLFTVTLKQIGSYLAYTQLCDAVDVLLNGDGNQNPAASETTPATQLSYTDLLNLWNRFDGYEMNTLLVSPDSMRQMLAIDEFKDPAAGFNFQKTGKLSTPLGAALMKSKAVPENTIIGLDNRFALEMVTAGDVMLEYDKLIDRQLERAAITAITGFAKIFKDASQVLAIKTA